MSSPAKKRKLNADAKQPAIPSRGLEYFFSKQRQNGSPKKPASQASVDGFAAPQEMTDEELARKLQAEWDQEDVVPAKGDPTDAGNSKGEKQQTGTVTAEPSSSIPAPLQATPTKSRNTLSLQAAGMAEDVVSATLPLDESPLTFKPAEHIQQLKDYWAAEGGNASYGLLTRCFVLVSGTQSRIKIVDTLVNCLRILIEADPESLLPAVSLNQYQVDAYLSRSRFG